MGERTLFDQEYWQDRQEYWQNHQEYWQCRQEDWWVSSMLEEGSRLFGTSTRTAVLVATRLLEETYPSELAELLDVRPYSVQTVLSALEREKVLISRLMGRTRMICLNPRYFAYAELEALLWKLGERDVELQAKLAARRRRPRRAGKPGLL